MFKPSPATQNLLLDYGSLAVPSLLLKAIQNKHWRVAWFAFLAVTASLAPVPAAGIFAYAYDRPGSDFKIQVLPTTFYISLGILVVYAISLIFARPPERYRLPRAIWNLADLLSYCYDSKIVCDREFSVQESSDEFVHLESKVHLRKGLYQFGMYLGNDGRRHIGFDRASRGDMQGQLVKIDGFDPGRVIHWRSSWQWWGLGRPRLLREKEE
jgi:hypothetical protein